MFHINTQIPRHGSTGAYIPGPRPHSTTPALSLSPLPPPSLHPCARRPSPLLRTSFLLAIAPPGPIFGALYLSLARAFLLAHLLALRAASFLARSHGRARGATEYLRSCFSSRPTPRPYPRPSFLSTPFLLLLLFLRFFAPPCSLPSSSPSFFLSCARTQPRTRAQFCASCNILFTSLLILWIPRRVRLRATILPLLLLLVSNRMGKTRNSIPDLVSRSLFAPEEANNERRRDLIVDRSEFASSF